MKYLIPLSEDSKWVQLLAAGKVKHPLHGVIDLSQERLHRFVNNFKAGVRGTDLDIDYDHKQDPAKGKKAAGWIKDLMDDARGLWAHIEWTDEARQAIKSGEYKYTSAEILDKWTDQNGKVHNDVLAGAAITNRPFLKNMIPVNLNEVLLNEEDGMNEELRKALIKKYQLNDDATEEQIKQAVHNEKPDEQVDLTKATVEWSEDGKTAKVKIPGADGEVKVEAPQSSTPTKATEPDDHLKKLAETDPQVKALLDEREEREQRMQRIEQAQRLSEVNQQLGEVPGLPPVVLTELRDVLVVAPKQFSDNIVKAVKTLAEKGFVPTGQSTSGTGPSSESDTGAGDAVKKFNDAVDEAKKANDKLSDADAYEKVAMENPLLYDQYASAIRDGRTSFQETE